MAPLISAANGASPKGSARDDFDLDAMLAEDFGDIFKDVDTNMDVPDLARPKNAVAGRPENITGDSLGLEEEVEVKKNKRVNVKLDQERLCSQLGIPKLKRISKTKLKLKGKGHEFTDVAKILSMYQIWLDELYPKASFADGLYLIEKLGHTRMMQEMRKEWCSESWKRPNRDESLEPMPEETAVSQVQTDGMTSTVDLTNNAAPPMEQTPLDTRTIWDDDLYSLAPPQAKTSNPPPPTNSRNDIPDEDELDAILAESAPRTSIFGDGKPDLSLRPAQQAKPAARDEIDDEMDFWDI